MIGLKSHSQGGAILIENSNLNLIDSTFKYNSAYIGGSISLRSFNNQKQLYSILNNSFYGNTATQQGGCINYDTYKPIIYQNNSFLENNYAPYGNEIASYPTDFRVMYYDQDIEIASGQEYQGIIIVEMLDDNQQRVTLNSTMIVQITALKSEDSVLGKSFAMIQNGIAKLQNFTFIANPGSSEQHFKIFSSSINAQKIYEDYNKIGLTINLQDLNNAIISIAQLMQNAWAVVYQVQKQVIGDLKILPQEYLSALILRRVQGGYYLLHLKMMINILFANKAMEELCAKSV
eukprot:403336646